MYNTLSGEGLASSHAFSQTIESLESYIRESKPQFPVSVLRPDVLTKKAREFTQTFPGKVLYAVKCNPDERALAALIAGGVAHFDCASIGEIRLIRKLKPEAEIFYMHPIKARESIREAYFVHNVRAFVLDSADEIQKIIDETDGAEDLTLFVRMAVPNQKVATDFSSKFGAPPLLAAQLLKKARPHCKTLGVSFHVGTHCLDTNAYAHAVTVAAEMIRASGVAVEHLDIGGGFPADLDVNNPSPPFALYVGAVLQALRDQEMEHLDLLCEPGRGLVAAGGALVVRVEGRRGDLLYINDGTYGGIFEGGGSVGLPYPVQMVRASGKRVASTTSAFRLAGPTCDSVDMMKGPFMLPSDIKEGDWIILDQLGAYGEVSRTGFNGFDQVIKIEQIEKKKARGKVRKAA